MTSENGSETEARTVAIVTVRACVLFWLLGVAIGVVWGLAGGYCLWRLM